MSTQFEDPPSTRTSIGVRKECPDCEKNFESAAQLQKHVNTRHTRPFHCLFHRYGCLQTFGSKNEWTRHTRIQHLHLEVWRCDIGKCGIPSRENDCHLFHREDLLTQHLRRMHKELYKSIKADDSTERTRVEVQVQHGCHVTLRQPPSEGSCPYCPIQALTPVTSSAAKRCSESRSPAASTAGVEVFDSWEAFLEHVHGHFEKGAGTSHGDGQEALGLRNWLLSENLLKPEAGSSGETIGWRIVGPSGKKKNATRQNTTHADAAKTVAVKRRGKRTRRSTAMEVDEDDEGEFNDYV